MFEVFYDFQPCSIPCHSNLLRLRLRFRFDSIRVDSIFDSIRLDADSLICSCSGNERICVNRLNKVDWSVAECLVLESILELGENLIAQTTVRGAWGVCVMHVMTNVWIYSWFEIGQGNCELGIGNWVCSAFYNFSCKYYPHTHTHIQTVTHTDSLLWVKNIKIKKVF